MRYFLILSLGLLSFQFTVAQINTLNEDFSTCLGSLPNGWTQYSVVGTDTWSCTASGYTNRGVYMNGYSGGNNNNNQDWLISPLLNLSTYSKPELSFICRTKFSGSPIQVFISNNYNGSGNPNNATWNHLNVPLPANGSDIWFLSDGINLTAYKNQNCYIAFKYLSNTDSASLWKIDNIRIEENGLSLQNNFTNVGQTQAGTNSSSTSMSFTMNNIVGTLELQAPTPFQISKNNVQFSNSLNYDANASGIAQNVYIRISPNLPDKVFRDSILFLYNGIQTKASQYLLGTSMPDNKTLRIANWNMRWFGEPGFCNCDTAISKSNAIKIFKDLNADIYCVQEVVNINQLQYLTNSLGADYEYAVSPYGSGALNPQSGFYQNCQKLAYIYNTKKIQNIGTYGLLASTYPQDTAAYSCFSSGRFPFMMKANLKLDNAQFDTLILANIHSKAGNTQSDYDRRTCGVQKMVDSLNTLYAQNKVMIIGDFNDILEGTTVVGNINSPYKFLLDNGYTGITLPSIYPGQSTYIGNTNFMIDNIICKSNFKNQYIDSSFFIFTEATKIISDFKNTTSDHYPCMSYYKFNFPNSITNYEESTSQSFFSLANPSTNLLQLNIDNNYKDFKLELNVYDLLGNKIKSEQLNSHTSSYKISIPNLNSGIYFVELKNKNNRSIQKWLVE